MDDIGGRAHHGSRRPRLVRGADGKLRPEQPTGHYAGIGDLWAEQRRIRLSEAIEQDAKRAERRKRRGRLKKLFGGHPKQRQQPEQATFVHGLQQTPKRAGAPKELAISFSLPAIRVPKAKLTKLLRLLAAHKKIAIVVGCMGAAVAVLAAIGPVLHHRMVDGGGHAGYTTTAIGPNKTGSQAPDFATLLPAGKTIEDLGGWAKVSPPGNAPVYAYVDRVGGVQVIVSEQQLPAQLSKDESSQVANLAQQFDANTKIQAGSVTAYVGTSVQGPQSVILAKAHLLILIKSTAKLADQQWADYIASLQ